MKKIMFVIISGMIMIESASCMFKEGGFQTINPKDISSLTQKIKDNNLQDEIPNIIKALLTLGGALYEVQDNLLTVQKKANANQSNRYLTNLKNSIKKLELSAKGLHPTETKKEYELRFLKEITIETGNNDLEESLSKFVEN